MNVIEPRGQDQAVDRGASLHHVDHRLLARCPPGERRFSIKIVEIFGDCCALGKIDSVIKLRYWEYSRQILGEEGGLLVLSADEVNGDELNLRFQLLLRQHDADARGVWKSSSIEDLHG